MRKTICDRCGEDCTQFPAKISVPIHIVEAHDGLSGYGVMQGGRMIGVSGRDKEYDLCLSCYNDVWTAAYKEIKGEKE